MDDDVRSPVRPIGSKAAPDLGRRGEESRNSMLSWASLLYFFCSPLDLIQTPLGTVARWTALLFFSVWIVELMLGSVKIPRRPGLLLVLTALLLWSFTTVLWSYAPSVSMTQSVTTTLLVLAAVAISSGAGGSALRPAAAMALGSAVAAVATLTSGLHSSDGQASFLGIDQNALAFHLALGLASALFVSLHAQGRKARLAAVAVSILLVASLVQVGSRTGIGATIALAATFLLYSARTPRRVLVALGVLGAGMLAVWLVAMAGLIPPRVFDWLGAPIATDNRELIIQAFRLTQDEWVFKGIGAGADANYLFIKQDNYRNAHSAFWKVLIEMGAIGLSLWGLLLTGLARRAYRSPDRAFFILASLPIALFFYTLGPINSHMLWATFGLALGASFEIPKPSRRALSAKARQR